MFMTRIKKEIAGDFLFIALGVVVASLIRMVM